MNYKLLFASLAVGLGAMATSASAAPTVNLSGVNAADGSKLLQTVRDDYDNRRGDRWSHNNRWDDNDNDNDNGHRKWWWHRRHHDDRDYRWSWTRDRDDRDGHRHR